MVVHTARSLLNYNPEISSASSIFIVLLRLRDIPLTRLEGAKNGNSNRERGISIE
jgi:hypothetical protein